MQLWQIIIQIGKAYNFRLTEFEIMTKNGPLRESIYSHFIEGFDIHSLNIRRKEEKKHNTENPRRVIAQDKNFIQRLFAMMTKMSNEPRIIHEIISLMEILPVNLNLKKQLTNQILSI